MIQEVEVRGYKALRYARVRLSDFHVLVGPNASGKSTFFDVLLLVRDILLSGVDKAIFGDARFDIPVRAADPLELSWLRQGGPVEIAITANIPEEVGNRLSGAPYRHARYELAINLEHLSISQEALWLIPEDALPAVPLPTERQLSFFPSEEPFPASNIITRQKPKGWRSVVKKTGEEGNDYFQSETTGWNNIFRFGSQWPALRHLPEDEGKFPISIWFKRLLNEGVQRIALNAEAMRASSPAGSSTVYLPDGSNLPWVVQDLEDNAPDHLEDWITHVRTVLGSVRRIETVEKPEDRSRYLRVTYDNDLVAPSWLLSDGTLRFLALTLLAYTRKRPSLILIEEPENGIHPKGIEGIIQSLSSVYGSQVFCATHSPVVLSLVQPKDILCFGRTREGAVDIRSGDHHPRLRNWQSSANLGDLFAAGVLG